jgi:hypothetical protein
MLFLKVLGFIFVIAGAITVFGAQWIIKKYNLDKSAKCNFETEMSEAEMEQYKYNKALVNIKTIGMLISIPGIVIILIAFK